MPERPVRQFEQPEQKKQESATRAKREELFAQIAEVKGRPRILNNVDLVFEHSVEDGLFLADQLHLSERELFGAIDSPGFIVKHREVYKQLVEDVMTSGVLKDIEMDPAHKKIIDILIEHHDTLTSAEKHGNWGIFSAEMKKIKDWRRDDDLAGQIDDYYAPLLKTRKFSPKKISSKYPAGERAKGMKAGETRELKSVEEMADEALQQYGQMLFPTYYSRSVEDILKKYLIEHNLSGELKKISEGILIVEEDIEDECDRLGIPYEEIEPRLSGAKYVSLTAGLKAGEAERGLLKKLNQSLEPSGQKAELVGDKYEVVEDKDKKEKKEESDGWDDTIPEQASKTLSTSVFEINSTKFYFAISEDGFRKLYVRRGDSSNYDKVSEDFEVFDDISNIERLGRKLKITGLRRKTQKIETQEVTLDIDKIRRLEKEDKEKEKKPKKEKSDYWSGKEILPLEGQEININGVNLKRVFADASKLSNFVYIISGTSEPASADFEAVDVVSKVVRKGDKIIRSVEITLPTKARSFDQEIQLFTDKIDSYKKKQEKQSKELTPEEKKQLDLINLLHHPTTEGIFEHFGGIAGDAENEKKHKKGLKDFVSGSPVVTGILNRIIGEEPKTFLETMPAKRDQGLVNVFAEQLAIRIFPEIRRAREESTWRGFSGYAGLKGRKQSGKQADPQDYLRPSNQHEIVGGGAEELRDNRGIVEFRDALGGFISLYICGRYNPKAYWWEDVDFPFDAPLTEPTMETTGTISNVGKLFEVELPKPLEARVIPERVKGFDGLGQEYDLKIEVNNLGGVKVVSKPKAVEKIVYSLAVSLAPAPMEDLSQKDYNLYKQQFEVTSGRDLTSSLSTLPEDLELELLSVIEGKSPKDQVMAIERLVRDLGYYDQNNQEVNELKSRKSLEEQMYIMEQRIEELRQKHPELAEELKGKRFAGVCADFAQLTAILLRRAGFASGTIYGFSAQEKKIAVKHAHATAFVVWPNEDGKTRVISVDGTPDGVAGVSLPSLVEQEAKAMSQEKELSAAAIKEIQKIIEGLNKLDTETVRQMSNGELEKVLNDILKYQVKESHLAIIERLFDYYWYTPIHQLDLANPNQQGEAISELASAVERQRKRLADQPEKDETPAGNKLMSVMQDFLGRFEVAGVVEDKQAALELMEKITELVQNDLSEVEKKAAFAVIAYLKAKNILGEKVAT